MNIKWVKIKDQININLSILIIWILLDNFTKKIGCLLIISVWWQVLVSLSRGSSNWISCSRWKRGRKTNQHGLVRVQEESLRSYSLFFLGFTIIFWGKAPFRFSKHYNRDIFANRVKNHMPCMWYINIDYFYICLIKGNWLYLKMIILWINLSLQTFVLINI